MRRWREAAGLSTRLVAERPELWLPGALAWIASVGWIPFLVAIARPPSVAELTFFGARIVSSGAWPWNAVLIGAAAAALVLAGFVLTAGANAVLIGLLERRRTSGGEVVRHLAINLVVGMPAALSALVVLLAVVAIAPREFNAPDPDGGPLLRTVVALTPYLVLLVLTTAAGGALAAIAGRLAADGRHGFAGALRSAPGVALGAAAATHAFLSFLAQLVFLGFGALLLGVLWAPIGAQLAAGGEIDVAISLLLVGFIAVWLCLVLAGGALHAWSAATWSRLLPSDASKGPESTWKT